MFQAKAKVSSAKLSLTSAQNTLTQILAQPTEQELATAESKVTSARLSVQTAEESLIELQGPLTALQLAQSSGQ